LPEDALESDQLTEGYQPIKVKEQNRKFIALQASRHRPIGLNTMPILLLVNLYSSFQIAFATPLALPTRRHWAATYV